MSIGRTPLAFLWAAFTVATFFPFPAGADISDCTASAANQQPTMISFVDLTHLPSACLWVYLDPGKTIKGIRCDSSSVFSQVAYGKSCRDPLNSNVVFSNGEPNSIAVFGGQNAFQLGSGFNLSQQIDQWWQIFHSPTVDAPTKGNIEVLLASAYDQVCRDSYTRTSGGTCQFPFPDLQNSRSMALGLACTPGDVLNSYVLFSNGTEVSQEVFVGADHLSLMNTLNDQISEWWSLYNSRPDLQGNLKVLLQAANDQICRCEGTGSCPPAPFPELSRQPGGGASWMSNAELGVPKNLLVNGDFSLWPSDKLDVTTPDGAGLYTAQGWWVAGGGPGAQVHITRGTLSASDLPYQAGYQNLLNAQWMAAATEGETATSTRTTWIEYHWYELASNTAYFSNQIVLMQFYVRYVPYSQNAPPTVALIPIVWQAFGNKANPPIVIYDGSVVQANSDWQLVQRYFRLPGTRGLVPQQYAETSLGLDFQNVVGFLGGIQVAGFSVSRVTPQ